MSQNSEAPSTEVGTDDEDWASASPSEVNEAAAAGVPGQAALAPGARAPASEGGSDAAEEMHRGDAEIQAQKNDGRQQALCDSEKRR